MAASGLTCYICNAEETKYRCSRCQTPSCSLNCFKSHDSQCRPSTMEETTDQLQMMPTLPINNTIKVKGNPAKDSWDESAIRDLFAQHSNLQQQLRRVYDARTASPSVETTQQTTRQLEKLMKRQGLTQLRRELGGESEIDSRAIEAFRVFVETNHNE